MKLNNHLDSNSIHLTSHGSSEPIILWGIGVSPYVRKVQIALNEKNLAYTHEPILPTSLAKALSIQNPIAFEQASPLGKIPALQVGTACLADSTVICAYLDKKFPEGIKLYSDNPETYAQIRWFENYADTIFSEVAYKKIFVEAVVKPKVLGLAPDMRLIEQAKRDALPLCLEYLEQVIDGAEWVAGDAFSAADIALITHFISLRQADFHLEKSPWKNLYHYMQRVIERPSVKAVLMPNT